MLRDRENMFSDAQAITVSAASTNKLNLGKAGPAGNSNGAPYSQMQEILFTCDESFTADGAGTLTIAVRSSKNADMSSSTTHDQSAAIPKASLVAGKKVPFQPKIPQDAGQYVDLYYTVGTGPMTAGKISAAVVAARQSNK